MKITVKVVQHVEDEPKLCSDSTLTFNSIREFKDARKKAIENWKEMNGRWATIKETGMDLNMTVKPNMKCGDYETWTLMNLEDEGPETREEVVEHIRNLSSEILDYWLQGEGEEGYDRRCKLICAADDLADDVETYFEDFPENK